jgi:hypothetical protein
VLATAVAQIPVPPSYLTALRVAHGLAHPGDVRCGGRPHGRAPAEGRRQAGLQHGVQAGDGSADPDRREDALADYRAAVSAVQT